MLKNFQFPPENHALDPSLSVTKFQSSRFALYLFSILLFLNPKLKRFLIFLLNGNCGVAKRDDVFGQTKKFFESGRRADTLQAKKIFFENFVVSDELFPFRSLRLLNSWNPDYTTPQQKEMYFLNLNNNVDDLAGSWFFTVLCSCRRWSESVFLLLFHLCHSTKLKNIQQYV